jgi:hypothetical protein
LQACDHAELRERVVLLSEHEVETEQAKLKDHRLRQLRMEMREVVGGYNETVKFLKARRRLAILLMQQRGRPVSP